MIKSKMTFNNVKALLIDLTGVLYESGSPTPIEGSPKAIELIRQRKLPFRFLTNETQISREKIAAKLTRIGYDVNVNEIISPGPATREFLFKNNLRPYFIIHPGMT